MTIKLTLIKSINKFQLQQTHTNTETITKYQSNKINSEIFNENEN